ncbi:Na/Pi cotransporter family protein [Winogradskyella luteola]|uniref:Na/Pi cotransporter family protein n=1 Tax=Winogradskyella luteola TaxID=2828330 RepID=A0A9X1F8P5_9FLAO|nr:Na/Pi symporter [Winogradskyella luteola]MBV7269537.1 Na/Pi cotransporter family protein [Winogradskyella luteola]
MNEILPLLIGGISLFLYAITQLSSALRELFTDKAKKIVETYTPNLLATILIGTVLTILLGSSSAMIIIVIVFVNAKTLNFRQSIGLIMGANIGTTFSSQIIALDIGKYSIIALFIGLFFEVFVKNEKKKLYGKSIFYFGMLFFGLYIMEDAVQPLKNSATFLKWIARVEDNPVQGTLIGGLVTLIIQSSSGTVGMSILLGKEQILSVAGGIAIMLGAELGTCSDTLLATINGRREALKTGLFHLIFNLITIIIGLIFFMPFVDLVNNISSTKSIGGIIANAHMLFNIMGVLFFLPFVGLAEKLLNTILPEKDMKVSNV